MAARTQSGITEYPIPTANSGPRGIALGPDGALWFTEYIANRVGRIAPGGQFMEFPLPTQNAKPEGIVAGSDGGVWFVESAANKVGRIDATSGQITEYPIPVRRALPKSIALGSDGALWFTEPDRNRIGHITTAGSFREYRIPTRDAGADRIATGPGATLWFTESEAGKIGTVTTAGGFTEFSTPGGNVPKGIAIGPDGATLWFTESRADAIVSVTTSGQFTAFSVPTKGASPLGIASGADGAIWFTELSKNKIGRLSSGSFIEYKVPTLASHPNAIVAGPAGIGAAMWFTEYRGNNIGAIAVTTPTPTPSPPPSPTPTPTGSPLPGERILHSFQGGSNDGANPLGGVISDSTGTLYGTTEFGGNVGAGTVFKLTPAGSGYTEKILHAFQYGQDGAQVPAGVIELNGSLFGTTTDGGGSEDACGNAPFRGCGTVFELTPSGSTYIESIIVRIWSDGDQSAFPLTGLASDAAGAIYGTTNGGSNSTGSAFKLSATNYRETVLYRFPIGSYPSALTISSEGTVYGTTTYGGTNNDGTVFSLAPGATGNYTYSTLYYFQGGSDGANPSSGVIVGKGGKLYGTTSGGGSGGNGTIFELTPSGSTYAETILYQFQGGNDGSNPQAALAADHAGTLYGTTYRGGTRNQGAVFKLRRVAGGYTEKILYSFQGGADGANPYAGVILDSAGAIYGTTVIGGGSANDGTVYEILPSGNARR